MRVTCRRRKRSDLGLESCRAYAAEEAYELELGATYTVYAQYLARGCLFYLIGDVDWRGLSRPDWYPAGFFDVTDGSLPSSWRFSYRPQHEKDWIAAIWGYPELLEDEHFAGLIERKDDAMMIWIRRKAEIDKAQDRDTDCPF